MHRTRQVGTESLSTKRGVVTVEFATSAQDLAPLQSAAYRILGLATCQIDEVGDRYRCELTSRADDSTVELQALKTRFLDFVTDENLRHRISRDTEGVRNVILALAFGALARTRDAENGV